MNKIQISKFLSLILRHKPESIGLVLDEHGWADTDELLTKINTPDFKLSFQELEIIVTQNDKKRFVFSSDLTKIRANQGHSIIVDLELSEKTPPDILFHGTAKKNIPSILEQGLIKGQRHHVHLSSDSSIAHKVGQRYGKPIVLAIKASEMEDNGIKFYLSENGVWLTEYVHPNFIERI